ncbi:DNA-directed RNA polymerase III subunit RPC7 [Fukomys damarensis]|uniref:DNA-directed RNA polymerase III subunit RPC7 n=1 Tax=Fukomys damarensis TaxID=885580 RepID=A0A091DMG1_FUKDA|nr:DNA-directed RNA polymerase III subunit RPC7 [Fukomys damarensis]
MDTRLEKTPKRDVATEKIQKSRPKIQKRKRRKVFSLINAADVLKKIEELEKKGDGEKSDEENEEKEGRKEKSKGGDDDNDDDAEQEDYDEEELGEEEDSITHTLKTGMILVLTVMTTWMKQPINHELSLKHVYNSSSEYLNKVDLVCLS